MDEYKKPYLSLFNAVTNAILWLQKGRMEQALQILIDGQIRSEEIFIGVECNFADNN